LTNSDNSDIAPKPEFLAQDIAILHEDAALVVVEKPIGLPVIPGRYDPTCLVDILSKARGEKLWVVHRIDQETSGIVLFARTAESHRFLSMAFEHHKMRKRYLALVDGAPNPKSGEIRGALHQFGSGRMGVDPRGKTSLTMYRTLGKADGLTLVEGEPRTGRRHQLRVHFHSLGTPIAGDGLYGDKTRQKTFPRMYLHAAGLLIPHPDGTQLRIESPLPESFPKGFVVPTWEPIPLLG
jgi:RluA family pseudouridine synthase